ncbi:MAG: glycosyltransferase [Bacteroidota bacterium]
MNGNKTLIILTPGFPANESDSTCLPFPQLFVKTLKQLHPSLQIIVFAFQYPFVKSEYEWYGVRVISFNGQNKGKLNHLLIWNAVWNKLNAVVKENNITGVLNFWLGECAFVGKYFAKKYKLRSFTWLLGQDARKANRYFSLIKPVGENLIALSDFIAGEFYRNYKIMPANIIPPGINTNDFSVQPMVRNIDILGAGSLIPLKQYDVFIRMVASLALNRPNIKTVICGKGPEKIHLQTMIDNAGLSANIELCGELSHGEVIKLMQQSKVFLHPSSYEGFGVVFAEALYAGASVVAFCQPMNIIFKNQHIVKTENQMLAKINELLDDVSLTHESVITYSIEAVCTRILRLYGI